MALVVKDRVQESTTTSGTGTLTFTGPIPGFQTFSSSIGNGNVTFYTIHDTTAQVWEVGVGTVGAGTLSRDTVLSNSSGTTALINLAGNSSNVFCTYPAEKSINYDVNGVATIGEVLGYADTGIVGSFASTVAGYNQVVVQNKSTAANASSNLNVSNDAGTASANYAELGINSSTFTGTGSFNIAGASYVASASTDLTLGTYGAYNVHFVTNSSTTDAMTIFNNGGISLGGFANPGIGNMAASKFVPGYTAITSAAGTTVLTAASNYYQNLLGSTTQTFQLPDATTLLEGTTFIFDNDSSGTLTVVDNATGPIETVPGGAASFVYLADNATVAGTWRRHAFLPASYDFNATTANFGTATITNATWNGNTIGTAYGGTGLTTFSAANNALYSTGASTLTAGTLPIAAGGTGTATAFTTGSVVFAGASGTYSQDNANFFWDDTNNYLGIGTASPATKLDVLGAKNSSIVSISASLSTVGGGAFVDYSELLFKNTAATNGDSSIRSYSNLWSSTGSNLAFFTNGASALTERMRIDSSGNVGIGTTNPAGYKVRIVGTSGTSQFRAGTDANGYLEINAFDSSPVYCTIAGANATSGVFGTQSNIPTIFFTNNTERMRIDSSGNVGIGVTPAGTGLLELKAGTATVAPIELTSGTNLTTPVAGTIEYDGAVEYFTNDTTSGRGFTPNTQIFRLAANVTAFGPAIGNFFGANSAINLAAGGVYEIVAYCRFTKTTAGTVTVTATTSAAPVNLSGTVQYGVITGGTATGAANQISLYNSTATAAAFGASGSLTTAVNHTFIVTLLVEANASASNLRINFTQSAGTVTPLRTSYYKVTRLPATNTGSFAA